MNRFVALKVFVTVAEQNNFAAAADRLFMSRSSVSRYIQELEDHLGIRLIDRSTRHVGLTEAGSIYYQHSKRLLDNWQALDERMGQLQSSPSGHLKIMVAKVLRKGVIDPLVPAFLSSYPEITLEIDYLDQPVDVIDEGYDFGLCAIASPTPGRIVTKFGVMQDVVVASPDYCERYGIPDMPEALKEHRCIIDKSSHDPYHWPFMDRDGPIRIKVKGPLIVNCSESAYSAALQGLGIAYLPKLIVDEDLKEGRLVAVMEPYLCESVVIYGVYPQNRLLSTKLQVFVEFLKCRIRLGASLRDWGSNSNGSECEVCEQQDG